MGFGNRVKTTLFFRAPAFADPDKTLAARQIFSIVRAFVLSAVFLQIVQIALAPKITVRWLALLLGTIAVSLFLLEFVRRGHVRPASFLLVLSLWLLISIFSWSATGLGARAAWGYFIVVFISGMLLGKWMGIAAAGICSASTLGLALGAPIMSPDPIRFWLINTMYLVAVLLLQDLASRSIRASLERAKNELRERQLAETELRKSDERFKQLSSLTSEGIIIQAGGVILDANQAFAELAGYANSDQLIGKNGLEIISFTAESRQRVLANMRVDSTATYEVDIIKPDGSLLSAETHGREINYLGRQARLVSMIDITKRKQSERALQERENMLSSIFRAAPTGIGVVCNRVLTLVNSRICEMTGWNQDELIGKSSRILYVSDADFEYVGKEKYRQIAERGTGTVETRWQCKDGRIIDVLLSSTPINPLDQSAGVTFTALDITDRKQGEEKLLESERRYRTLFESAGDAIFLLHGDRIIDCNSKTLEVFGCGREQIISLPISRFHPAQQPDGSDSLIEGQKKNTAALHGDPQFFEWRHIRFDGTSFDAEVSLARIQLVAGDFLLALVRDISERKKLEEQLRQAQKMEAIGILAGGVAHDFNNILSTIVGYTSLLQMKQKAGDPFKEYIERILTASERAVNLTSSLLAFSRKQEIELRPLDINDTIYGFHKILARLIGEDIDFHLDLASRTLVVDADVRQVEQLLMNLANNSRDAMPRGGKLTIRTEAVVLKEPRAEIPAGSYAVITVADSGTGMSKDVQAHIFEPFFTTKEVGKGTGLGLAIVYGIVKKHSGFIHMASISGAGTAFSIYLPLKAQSVKKTARRKQEKIPSGSETILLIEDDAAVRQVTRSMLEEFGYTVLEAANGIEAQTVFQRQREQVQLILCDLIMPRMNGRETHAAIKKIKVDIKVIFMSGYTADIIAGKGIADPGIQLLQKPLNPSTLLKKIRSVLDKQ
ncbi:MAG: PAS domain S-box protein [Candidatus Aminicenantes bacterium]|nr:PAS domain S-box protein [Candidatus Aminicenantes bacterium]